MSRPYRYSDIVLDTATEIGIMIEEAVAVRSGRICRYSFDSSHLKNRRKSL